MRHGEREKERAREAKLLCWVSRLVTETREKRGEEEEMSCVCVYTYICKTPCVFWSTVEDDTTSYRRRVERTRVFARFH